MSNAKVVAFFQEFPFLRELLSEDEVWDVRVQRVDYDLFDKVSRYSELIDWFGEVSVPRQSVHMLLDEKGRMLTTVGIRWWNPTTWSRARETVGDAIARLGDQAALVSFVVCFWPYISDRGVGGILLVCKSPKGFTIQDLLRRKRAAIQKEICQEQAAIRAESEAIDTLADQK